MKTLVLALIVGTLGTTPNSVATEFGADDPTPAVELVATFPVGATFTVGELPGIDPAAADPWLADAINGWNAAAGREVFRRAPGTDQTVTFDFDTGRCPPAASGCTDVEVTDNDVITGCRVHLVPGVSSYIGSHELGHCLGAGHGVGPDYYGVMTAPTPDNPSDRAWLVEAGIAAGGLP